MAFTPQYLKDFVKADITAYEVTKAAIGGVEVTTKALSADNLQSEGIEPTEGMTYYRVKMAGSDIDRHRERFTPDVLTKYASDVAKMGASVNFGHYSQNIIGKVVKAWVNGTDLMGVIAVDDKATMPNQTAISINEAISKGMVKDVSVEVSGLIRVAEKDENGWATAWEYFIDPNRPDATEFHGLAIVQRGAQRGASIVKGIDGGASKTEISPIMKDTQVFVVNGKGLRLDIEGKDGSITVNADQVKALETAINELETKAKEADTQKAVADGFKAEIAALRQPYEADVINAQKALNMPESEQLKEEAVKALPTAELIAKSKELMGKLESGKSEDRSTETTYKLDYQ